MQRPRNEDVRLTLQDPHDAHGFLDRSKDVNNGFGPRMQLDERLPCARQLVLGRQVLEISSVDGFGSEICFRPLVGFLRGERGRDEPPLEAPEAKVVLVQKMTCWKGLARGERAVRRVPRRERPERPEVQLKMRTREVLRFSSACVGGRIWERRDVRTRDDFCPIPVATAL